MKTRSFVLLLGVVFGLAGCSGLGRDGARPSTITPPRAVPANAPPDPDSQTHPALGGSARPTITARAARRPSTPTPTPTSTPHQAVPVRAAAGVGQAFLPAAASGVQSPATAAASESARPTAATGTSRPAAAANTAALSSSPRGVYSLISAIWYIDPNATGTADGKSWGNAWTSFGAIAWTAIKPGDTLYLSGGPTSQVYNTRLTVGASGASGKPITISTGQTSGHNGRVIINGGNRIATLQRGIDLNSKNYVTVTGNVGGAKNLVVQNFVCSTSDRDTGGGAAIWAVGQHNVIDHVEVRHAMNGIYVSQTAEAFLEVKNCNIHDIEGDYGIRCVGYTGTDFNNLHVHDCAITTNAVMASLTFGSPDGIQAQNGITVHDNIIRCVDGTVAVGGQHADGIQGMGSYHKVYNNYFANHLNSGCKMGPIYGGLVWQECYILNNIFGSDISNDASGQLPRGLELMPDSVTSTAVRNIVVANNTFVDVNFLAINGATHPASTSSTISGVVVKNNIFFNCGRRATGTNTVVTWDNSGNGPVAGLTFDYNDINAGSDPGNTLIKVDNTTITQAHPRSGAPTFVKYNKRVYGSDFHLAAGDTGAQGLGTDLASLFAPLSTDKDGKTRTDPWDIGALQH